MLVQPNGEMMVSRAWMCSMWPPASYINQPAAGNNVQFMTIMATKMPFVGRG